MRSVTTAETLVGDFNSDHVVDTADYDMWVAGDAAADADGDGTVLGDMDDFNIWEAHFGTVRADVFPTVENGTNGMPLENPDAAPVVLGVTIGGYDYSNVVGSGEQLRSAAVASPNTVSIRFSEEVYVTVDACSLSIWTERHRLTLRVSSKISTQTATWTFDAPFADGRTLMRLSDSVFDLDHEMSTENSPIPGLLPTPERPYSPPATVRPAASSASALPCSPETRTMTTSMVR